jgi:predicted ATPase
MENGGHAVAPDFGALLRRYRLAAGLSQEALAERARLSPYGISALERGYRRTPQRETLELLVGALALNGEQRQGFETAAARAASPRRRDGAAVTLGPWPSLASGNLPVALTRFFGRDAELEEIAALIAGHRLVTLTGPGGVGKTQTALRAATALSDEVGFSGALHDDGNAGACFVALAPISDPSFVVAAIAMALGVQEVPNHPLLETLGAYLKNKTLLLILDNCEHVIKEAAAVAEALLTGCPRLRILATSREALRAAGEQRYRLRSLNEQDARVLFIDRAQSVECHFALTNENASIVANLCQRLDGIPLAIELAAARTNVLSLETLASKLNDRFAVLTVGHRTALPRQQTMRAAIDWSYDLLATSEQKVFERLSAFSGGCTIEAATRVCANGDVGTCDVLALISSLVDKSLVVADLEGIEPRYRLLESFREYAQEKLKDRGEENAVASRHALAYLEKAEWFNRSWDKLHYTVTQRYAPDELNNWRAAVQWALTGRGDVPLGQRLVGSISSAWGGSAFLNELRRWVAMAVGLVDDQTPLSVVAKLKCEEASVARHLDNHRAQLASAEQAVALFREVGDELGLMRAQQIAGNALYDLGRYREARVRLDEALSIARKSGSWNAIANTLRELACASMDAHEFEAAHHYLDEAFQLLKAADDQIHLAWATVDLANLVFEEGDTELAIPHLERVLAMTDALVSAFGAPSRISSRIAVVAPSRISSRIAVVALEYLSAYLIFLDRYDEAKKRAREALDAALNQHLDVLAVFALEDLSVISALQQQTRANAHETCMRAARVAGFVDARVAAMGSARDRANVFNRERALAALYDQIGDNAVAELMALGAAMTQDQAVEEALAL